MDNQPAIEAEIDALGCIIDFTGNDTCVVNVKNASVKVTKALQGKIQDILTKYQLKHL